MNFAPPTTTETILQEDGAEAALEAVAFEVREAEEAIRKVLRESSADEIWTIRSLQDAAAEGHSSTVMSIAFLGLLKAGELRVDHASSIVERV